MIKNGSILIVSALSVLVLSSCSRGVIETVDKSVEYQSAKALPPLKKERAGVSTNTVVASNDESQFASVIAQVVNSDKSESPRLVIKSDPKTSWKYLDHKLKVSDVTVYNRNQTAGFFSVGCGGTSDIPVFEQSKGGFSIPLLKRKKKTTVTEYCRLQVTSARKKKTEVTFFNRYGQDISGQYVDDLLARISNN